MDRVYYLAALTAEAVGRTLDEWQVAHPGMGVLAMLPEAEKEAVPLLQAECAQRNIPLVGGIFPELLADNTFCRNGCWMLRFNEMPYFALHGNLTAGSSADTATAISAGLSPMLQEGARNNTLLLLFDAMVPNISSLLDELYLQLANRVHYVGANAGSETFQPMPCLFDGERVVGSGVLVLLLTPHQGAVLEHGYQLPPQSMIATSTEGNRIEQIDWRPAFEVYRDLVRAQFGVEVNRDNFYQYAVHFPFGIVRANHNVVVRIPVALGDDGSLFCVGEVPPHSVLALLEAPTVDSTQTLDTLTAGLQELNGDLAQKEVLLFYCAGRRMHLGVEAAAVEVRELAQRTRAGRVAGALSLGEIGGSTLWSYPLFHNATLVASLW